MRFSIIVPIYKVEKYIQKCISTLIGQTYPDIEIILVDDGSPDRCPQICDEYAKLDNRIIVIHKQNGGLSDARNAGLEIASGDYVIFVDSDDYINSDTCERLLKYAETNCDILIGDAIVEGASIEMSHIQPTMKIYSGIEYLNEAFHADKAPMAAWLNIYKRNFLVENGLRFKCGILHEDEQFTPRALFLATSVIVTGVNFYHYFIRENSITTKKDKRKNKIATKMLERLIEISKQNNLNWIEFFNFDNFKKFLIILKIFDLAHKIERVILYIILQLPRKSRQLILYIVYFRKNLFNFRKIRKYYICRKIFLLSKIS